MEKLPTKILMRKRINSKVVELRSNKEKRIIYLLSFAIIFVYITGIFAQIGGNGFGKVDEWGHSLAKPIKFNPIVVIFGTILTKRGWISLFLNGLLVLGVVIWYRSSDDSDTYNEKGYQYSDQGTYGTAKVSSDNDIKEYMYLGNIENTSTTVFGTLNGNIVAMPREHEVTFMNKYSGHTAVVGVSGSGKTYSIINTETLQIIRRGESLIQSDPKGASYEETSRAFIEAGYVVKVFNLKPTEMMTSDSWNILEEINSAGEEMAQNLAQTFADIIVNNTGSNLGGKGDPFWDNAETTLLKALALYVAKKQTGEKNIGAMYDLLVRNSEIELKEIFNSLPHDHPATQPWLIFLKAGENIAGNVMLGLANRLNVFQSQSVRDLTSTVDIDLELPAKQKCAYYIVMSDQEKTYSFLSSLFFSFLFIRIVAYADSRMEKRCKVPVNILLDEFPNVGIIPGFPEKISTVRSRAIRIMFVVQNIGQLKDMYPTLWEALLSACDIQILLGSNDETTETYFSNKTGQATILNDTKSTSGSAINPLHFDPQYRETHGLAKRNLYTPDEINRLHRNRLLMFIRGTNVAELERYAWTSHPMAELIEGKEVSLFNRIPLYRRSKEFIDIYGIKPDVAHLVDPDNLKTLEELKEEEQRELAKYATLTEADLNPNLDKDISVKSKVVHNTEEETDIEELVQMSAPRRRRRVRRKPVKDDVEAKEEVADDTTQKDETPSEEPEKNLEDESIVEIETPEETVEDNDDDLDSLFGADSLNDTERNSETEKAENENSDYLYNKESSDDNEEESIDDILDAFI